MGQQMNRRISDPTTSLTTTTTSTSNSNNKDIVLDPNKVSFTLMISYPNSLSEYVSNIIKETSLLTTTVNYASINSLKDNKYKSIFAMNTGPYYIPTTNNNDNNNDLVQLSNHIVTSTN